jgi:hypothetical protein
MRDQVQIENIEEMRRQAGIDDVKLRQAVRGLRVGSVVRLTLLTGKPGAGETLPVRVTQINGRSLQGTLACRPASAGLAALRAGSRVAFTADHVHSILEERLA